jgi:hypothetical protein
MRTVRQARAVLAGTFVLATLAFTPGAAAATADSAPARPSVLVLTIAKGEVPEPVDRAVSLGCAPRSGDHPLPASTCSALAAVRGDITKLSPDSRPCTYEYRPLTVTARGVWNGELTEFQTTYPNRCVMLRATGTLFEF